MIALNRRTRIYVCKEVTDMRASYDSLYSRVKEQLKLDPYSGHLFLFVNRTRTSCKVLYYDGTGFVILQKRLDRGNFSRVNPRYDEEVILTEAEFGLFFEGSNLEKRFIDSPIARKNIQKKVFLKKRELQETVVTI
ncbi:MAG: IS66 family insertion sequence element accessory protein TnpB [Xanthomonadaceae bacterium]|nr:IS66 family insertion sequence element accessory protein TnpB [Xanthomonadaceae bacterium]MCM0604861.1 IS66 family insertion sequence element accessory protein TnpB [Xanthomonadaceae bacterium]MCM0604910.1 IS66 family insertion sequence element accessory protein TnpB [Xanthomonadaceae bacterium]MCM0605401.1 IS66 family insertion sequence element accessory protein TnpB [Xanthomonadaceae bacterium]